MWRSGLSSSLTGTAAYAIAAALASENLALGAPVIVDAVNPVQAARAVWRRLAEQQKAPLTFVECVCSDLSLHRARVEARVRNIDGMPEVTWDRVEARRSEYEPWTDERIVLDTAAEPLEKLVARTLHELGPS